MRPPLSVVSAAWRPCALVIAASTLGGAACGGASNSEVRTDAAGRVDGAVDDAPDGDVTGADGDECPAQTDFTLGVHVVLDVSWAATAATSAGAGKVHLWNRAALNANGATLLGDAWSCGTVLPDVELNFAGQVVTGGSKIAIDVPDEIWDRATMPKFPTSGETTGWNVGSTMRVDSIAALLGLTMPDALAPWPTSFAAVMALDHDGDGKPGFTAVPRDGNGYATPPTGLGAAASSPSADRVYLASRTVVALNATRSSCATQAGIAEVTFFDNHVVGCRLKGSGADCSAAQVDFVDQSRPQYRVNSATFTSRQLAQNATCADVRAALPM